MAFEKLKKRWGIESNFSLIIIFSFIFYYPDILRSNIVVTTENPPATLVARATGKIDRLLRVISAEKNSGLISKKLHFNNYPPAKPEVLSSLAPQKGLFATKKKQSQTTSLPRRRQSMTVATWISAFAEMTKLAFAILEGV